MMTEKSGVEDMEKFVGNCRKAFEAFKKDTKQIISDYKRECKGEREMSEAAENQLSRIIGNGFRGIENMLLIAGHRGVILCLIGDVTKEQYGQMGKKLDVLKDDVNSFRKEAWKLFVDLPQREKKPQGAFQEDNTSPPSRVIFKADNIQVSFGDSNQLKQSAPRKSKSWLFKILKKLAFWSLP